MPEGNRNTPSQSVRSMKALTLLKRAETAERRMNSALERMYRYKSTTEQITSCISGPRVCSTPDHTRHETAMINYFDAQEKTKQLVGEYNQLIDEIAELLDLMEDEEDRELIMEHYVRHTPFPELAEKMHVSRTHIYYRRDRALALLEKLIEQSEGEAYSA